MRTNVLATITSLLITVSLASATLAGPPMTGSRSSSEGTWMKSLNPTQWNWPSMPWAEEPPRIKKKTPSRMSSMNKTAKTSWAKTKRALDPTRMFEPDPKLAPQNGRAQHQPSDGGFFSGLFNTKEPKQIKTVNDFLSQPHLQ